jgi:hypothetical protein
MSNHCYICHHDHQGYYCTGTATPCAPSCHSKWPATWIWSAPQTPPKDCEHCYCKDLIVYGELGNTTGGKKHKKCCNCGHQKLKGGK